MMTKPRFLFKALNTVPYFTGNPEESTMMTEQTIWCESSRRPTTQEDMLNNET